MTNRLVIDGAAADPLRISAIDASGSFADLLFGSNYRSLRLWMTSGVVLGANSLNPTFNQGATTSFATVFFGKTFPAPPVVAMSWDQITPWTKATLVTGVTGFLQDGCFVSVDFDRMHPSKLGGGVSVIRTAVFDHPVNG